MTDQQPQDQSQPTPTPKPGQDWNEVSVQEIEQTLSSAADLAYELAGEVGVTPDQPKYRDTSGLESIETALDAELKQIEHLVDRTREQLSDDPLPAEEKGQTAAVPDFMSEFLSDQPVTVVPEPRALKEAGTEDGPSVSRSGSGSVSADISSAPRGQALETTPKVGLIGVGSLGLRETKKTLKPEKATTAEPTRPAHRSIWAKLLEGPLYRICDMAIHLLELVDRPFAKLGPTTRRAVSVTAIAAFCVCLAMFVLSLLMS